jgi:hypothetical protein
MGLLTKIVIGDTTMERNPRGDAGKKPGRRIGVPDAAAQLLDNYVRISIR